MSSSPIVKPYAHFHKLIGRYRRRIDRDLGKCTVIGGPNQTYKTTLAHNFRLPINGKLPGVETHNAEDLCASSGVNLASGFANELHSVDGVATFLCPPAGKGTPALQPFTGRYAALEAYRDDIIISDIAEKMFSNKSSLGREAFIRAFGDRLLLPEPEYATPDQRDIWRKAIVELTEAGKLPKLAADQSLTTRYLADITEWLASELLKAGKALAKAQAKLEGAREMTRPVGPVGNDNAETIQATREALTAAQKWEAWQDYQQAADILSRSDVIAKLTCVTENHRWLTAVRARAIAANPAAMEIKCPLWGDRQIPMVKFDRTLAAFAKQVAVRTEESKGITPFAIETAKNRRDRALVVLGQGAEGTPTAPTQPVDLATASELSTKLAGLTRVGINSTVAPNNFTAMRDAVRTASDYRDNVQQLKALVADLNVRVLSGLVDTARGFMAERMGDVEPHITVGDKTIEWGVIGRQRSVSPFAQTSGRERGLLKVAGAQALARTECRIVIDDDNSLGAYDAPNILAYARVLFEAAQRGDLTQVILVWNRLPELLTLADEGWMVIDTTPR